MSTRSVIVLLLLAAPLLGQSSPGNLSVLSGELLDAESGLPIAGARVEFAGHRTRSDSLGRYRLQVLPTTGLLAVHSIGYLPEQRILNAACVEYEIVLPSQREPCELFRDIRLRRAPSLLGLGPSECSLQGRVESSSGEPLQSVLIELEVDLRPPGALTDAAGNYRVDDVPVGVYLVKAESIGFERQYRLAIVVCTEPERRTQVDFQLRRHQVPWDG